MQVILTASIEFVALSFCLLLLVDFAAGMVFEFQNCCLVSDEEFSPLLDDFDYRSAFDQLWAFANSGLSEPVFGIHEECNAGVPVQTEVSTTLPKPQPQVATLQWLEKAIAPDTNVETSTPNVIELALVRQPVPATLEVVEQPEETVDLTGLKLYKLRGNSVVKVADLQIDLPATIKRYQLHKHEVVRLADVETLFAA